MAFRTCQTVYNSAVSGHLLQFLPLPLCDHLWEGVLCGLEEKDALQYALNYGQPIYNARNAWEKDVHALYEIYRSGCQAEFSQLPEPVQRRIKKGPAGYLSLRHIAYQAVSEPLFELAKLTEINFLGKTVLVHPEFALRLINARTMFQQLQKEAGQDDSASAKAVKQAEGFQWRIRAAPRDPNFPMFTNHQFGMAVDLNAEDNPIFAGDMAQAADQILDFLQIPELDNALPPHPQKLRFRDSIIRKDLGSLLLPGREELIVLEYETLKKMFGHLLEFIIDTRDSRDTLIKAAADPTSTDEQRKHASQQLTLLDQFTYTVGEGKINDLDPQAPKVDPKSIKKRMAKGKEKIDRWLLHKGGIMTTPVNLIYALVKVGLTSGAEYAGRKDAMQFEIEMPVKNKCKDTLLKFGAKGMRST